MHISIEYWKRLDYSIRKVARSDEDQPGEKLGQRLRWLDAGMLIWTAGICLAVSSRTSFLLLKDVAVD